MGRDPAFEEEFLGLVERMAVVQGGASAPPVGHFLRLVRDRLDLGDRLYGQRFLERDGMAEALEEPCDAVAWSLLELQRRRAAGENGDGWDEARMELVAAAVLMARGDQAMRRAQRILDGGG